ncbi:MAG: PQQ-binding-like beta-propeller repeat protein, partial [Planctomycetota bacterium]
ATSAGVAIAIQHAGESFVATLDRDTGDTLWKADRTYPCGRESDQAYTTPAVVDADGRELIVTWGADHVTAHDVGDGERVWECDGFNPGNEPLWRAIASAPVGEGVVVVPHGRGDWLAAVRIDEPAVGESRLLWRRRGVGADVPTPWIDGETVYVLGDKSELTAVALTTGETLWSAELPRSRAKHFASPVVVGDLLYTAREDGSFTVFRIDEGVEVLSEGEFDETIVATPVLWGDDLLVRSRTRLYRFASGMEADE